jgi:hypothetical protein
MRGIPGTHFDFDLPPMCLILTEIWRDGGAMIYRRPIVAVLFALVCIGLANFVSLWDASTSTWANSDQRIDFHFPSWTVYEAVFGVVMGAGEIEGTCGSAPLQIYQGLIAAIY